MCTTGVDCTASLQCPRQLHHASTFRPSKDAPYTRYHLHPCVYTSVCVHQSALWLSKMKPMVNTCTVPKPAASALLIANSFREACRGVYLSIMVSVFLYSCWYSSSLPMMWDRPTPGLEGKGFWRNVDEVHTQPHLHPYDWLVPFQVVGGTCLCPEPFRSNFHLYILMFQLAVVWSSSFLYPMDWDVWYQEWPLPTVYSALIAHVITQFIIVVENSLPRRMTISASEEQSDEPSQSKEW